MTTGTIEGSPQIEILGESDGGNQRWSVWCNYRNEIPPDVQVAALSAIDTSAAFVQNQQGDEQMLLLKAMGYMDEAVASAIVSLRGIGEIIESSIRKVRITCLEDSSELEGRSVYDITHTVKTALES